MATKAIAWALACVIMWPSLTWAADPVPASRAQILVPPEAAPSAGVFFPADKAEQLARDLQDYSILNEKYDVVTQERDKLAEVVAEFKSADMKQKMALDIASEREKLRQEMYDQMKQALDLNTKTLQNTSSMLERQTAFMDSQKKFMDGQQKEIDSMRSERLGLIIFGGIFLLATSALLFFK